MIVGIVHESHPAEQRVAMTPAALPALLKAGLEVAVESGAGRCAGFHNDAYAEKGASIVSTRDEVLATADILCQVRTYGANPQSGAADLRALREGQIVVGFAEPLTAADEIQALARRGVALLAMELVPRITLAQSMDALSSQATVAGYKAVLLAAWESQRMFPMLMTAAGTIPAARVFVIGAGVAGLQAIASSRRLGALVTAYDVRPAVREQVESLGAKFLEIALDTGDAEAKGGYARAMDEAFYRRQREMMAAAIRDVDVVITTAAIPGKKSPVLITADMVAGMRRGAIIVDLAAERGGNCELTRADERIDADGVTILGPTNLPSTAPHDASQMYARNVAALLKHLMKDGRIDLERDDEILRETLVTRGGEVVHERVRDALGLGPLPQAAAGAAERSSGAAGGGGGTE
jgi:NAD(P) transhydrogenase subunit alpha